MHDAPPLAVLPIARTAAGSSAGSVINWLALADQILAGGACSRDEALAALRASPDQLLELLAAAGKLRRAHFGRQVKLNFLVNAKSGLCPEDCHYCSQSKHSDALIPRYPIKPVDELVAGADRAVALKASTCCLVISGRGPTPHEVAHVAEAAARIKSQHPGLRLCACLGLLKDGQAEQLKAAGVERYNHNLNTAEGLYGEICTTHTYQDRVDTVGKAKAAGISPCSGLIVGMGETHDQLVEVAFALRDLGADSIPVNFLLPIEGAPLTARAHLDHLTPTWCLQVLCMVRLVCPERELRVSAGREVHLRTLQPLSLHVANALFVADYLTEPGQAAELDWQMIEDAGFEIEGCEPNRPLRHAQRAAASPAPLAPATDLRVPERAPAPRPHAHGAGSGGCAGGGGCGSCGHR